MNSGEAPDPRKARWTLVVERSVAEESLAQCQAKPA
jgi:hypothetical protein